MKINNSIIVISLSLATLNLNTILASAEDNIDNIDNNETVLEINNTNTDITLDSEIIDTQEPTEEIQNNEIKVEVEYEVNDTSTDRKITSNAENVRKKFKQFYLYGPQSNPTIDLSNKNSLIKTYSQANNILLTKKDGKKTDRQLYLDAWNALTSKEKSTKEMKDINASYKNIISVSNAAKSVLKFYEDVKKNKDSLITNPSKASNLNKKSNKSLGARGKAYDDYLTAVKLEPREISKRLTYIHEKYLDTLYFLNVSKYIGENNKEKALADIAKIKDLTLKSTAQKAIDESFLTKNQENVVTRFKQFYLYGPQSNPSIDLTNKNSLIKNYSQAEGMLKTSENGTIYDRQKFLDAYNKLTSSEKKHPKIKQIKADYDNMITILEAAKSVFKFYDDVKSNASKLIYDPKKSDTLNSKENLTFGARGKAYTDYKKASAIEPAKSSKRIAYLNQKYLDTIYFLCIPKYIKANNIPKALELLEKVTDSTLKKVALDAIYDSLGNNFVITPDSPTYKNVYMSRPSYNENTKHYYLIRSYLEALDAKGGGTLTLKAGNYNITNALYVPSNVTIILDGAKLKKSNYTGSDSLTPSKSMFQLISSSKIADKKTVGRYNGEKNIKFIGKNNATLDLAFIPDSLAIIIGHNTNVEITGINFINMNGGHFIELDASKNVTIKSNTFKDSVAYGNLSKEAINLDTPDKLTGGWNSNWTAYDRTPNFNIYIENNLFSNLDRSIGTHKYSQGIYHTNIYVRNNTIEKTRSDSIRIMNWKDSFIENNIIKNTISDKSNVRGILASGAINPTIKDNTFINMPRPMQFFPTKNNQAGSEYDTSYNSLSEQNKADLRNNIAQNLKENFVRINEEYNVFTNPEKVYLITH